MPKYKVEVYNAESGMLFHKEDQVLAPDPETAENQVVEDAKALGGYGQSADGAQATASTPRFRVAVTEVE